VTQTEAINLIVELAQSGKGGCVVTPNVDHVVLAQTNPQLRRAYADAALSVVDGMPLKWMSALVGEPLPEKISGADLIRPLLRQSARSDLRVYFLGAAPGVAQRAADILCAEIPGLNIVGVDSPPCGFEKDARREEAAFTKMKAANPHLVKMALGCPKQELLMHRWHQKDPFAVYLGIGVGLDFIARNVKRCPPIMSELGIEWIYRITQEPGRLIKRYLMRDVAIGPVFLKMLRKKRHELIFFD